MRKRRGKTNNTKKIVSFMVVPHNSKQVKTWRISNIHLKLTVLFALFSIIVASLSVYITLVLHENTQLRKQQKELYSFITKHQQIVQSDISLIAQAEELDNLSKEKLQEFSFQVLDLTKNYIEKEMKTLTVSRSSASAIGNGATSFTGKIAELRALLNFLEDIDSQEDKLLSELSDKKEELRKYLAHLPTFWPTKGVIESSFGNRFHPIYKKFMDHTGVDIGGKKNSPIYAAASGTVTFAGKNGGYGYVVDIDHGNGLLTRYAHCSKILVKKWQKVEAGQEIAKVGDTGTTTGPHLHFEIRLNGVPIDPVIFIGTEANN